MYACWSVCVSPWCDAKDFGNQECEFEFGPFLTLQFVYPSRVSAFLYFSRAVLCDFVFLCLPQSFSFSPFRSVPTFHETASYADDRLPLSTAQPSPSCLTQFVMFALTCPRHCVRLLSPPIAVCALPRQGNSANRFPITFRSSTSSSFFLTRCHPVAWLLIQRIEISDRRLVMT